jgi:methionyl-tRNA formyltransferase
VISSPVKILAETYGIPVLQPEKVRSKEFQQQLEEIAPELIVVAAYGQIIPESILNIPPRGCINIHGSLLPKYRGAAPIHWAIIRGEKETGITTMFMDKGMDTGDMLLKRAIPIQGNDTAGSLHDKLSRVGAELLIETLQQLEAKRLIRIPQDDEAVTYAPILKKDDGRIDWAETADAIDRKVRGFFPWPGAYTYFQGRMLKLLKVAINECPPGIEDLAPGTVVHLDKVTGPLIITGKGCLRIMRIQPQNRKAMNCSDFCRGYHLEVGTQLGI